MCSEIKSATLQTKFRGFETKQVEFLLVGLALMFIISLIDYHTLIDIAPWAYGVSLVSLVAVRLVGSKVLGGAPLDQARRLPLPAIGVGQTRPDHRRGPLLLGPCRQRPKLA